MFFRIVNNINNKIIESEYSKIDTYVYEGFPWNSKIAAKSFIKDMNSNKSNSKKKSFIESNIYKNYVKKILVYLLQKLFLVVIGE